MKNNPSSAAEVTSHPVVALAGGSVAGTGVQGFDGNSRKKVFVGAATSSAHSSAIRSSVPGTNRPSHATGVVKLAPAVLISVDPHRLRAPVVRYQSTFTASTTWALSNRGPSGVSA